MDKIVEYLKNNPTYLKTLIIVFSVLLLVCIVIGILRKIISIKKSGQQVISSAIPDEITDEKNTAEIQKLHISEPVAEKENNTVNQNEDKKPSNLAMMIKQSFEKLKEPQLDEFEDEIETENLQIDEEPLIPEIKTFELDIKTKKDGFWRIIHDETGYFGKLVDSNDDILLNTQIYSVLSGVKSAIESIKKNVRGNNFTLSVDENGKFYFKLFSSSNRLICSGEPCETKAVCQNAIDTVKEIIDNAEIVKG